MNALKARKALKTRKALEARNKTPADSTPKPSCKGWQSERRHVDQPRQRNYSQVLQGGYPPEGPMAEVLRAEAKTAGSNQRICRPRNPHRRPPTPGPGPQARRSLVTFHRWKVTRRRRDQQTKRRESRGRSKKKTEKQKPTATVGSSRNTPLLWVSAIISRPSGPSYGRSGSKSSYAGADFPV